MVRINSGIAMFESIMKEKVRRTMNNRSPVPKLSRRERGLLVVTQKDFQKINPLYFRSSRVVDEDGWKGTVGRRYVHFLYCTREDYRTK
jgi:hypothetical protein